MATSTPPRPTFKPFVPTTETRPELSARALILGGIFGVLFGAVTVYVGLRAGQRTLGTLQCALGGVHVGR